jgi:hypothetical protein
LNSSTPIALSFGLAMMAVAYTVGGREESYNAEMRSQRAAISRLEQLVADLGATRVAHDQLAMWVARYMAQADPTVRNTIPEYPLRR